MTEEAQELWDEIEEMLDEPRFNFAKQTLQGIQDTVRLTGRATATQQQAIKNIRASITPGRGETPNWKRRYEGLNKGSRSL